MQDFIKKVVLGCLLIIPFVVLHVADGGLFDILSWGDAQGLFFPFISGKNILFRALVEIAFAGWAILALYDGKYRVNIKKSPIMIAYGIFIVILFLADIFGVDVGKSMWSNFERMEGFVGHIHFFLYFFVLTVMLPTLREWGIMFKAFLLSNMLVLIYAFGQLFGAKGVFFEAHFPKFAGYFATRFPIHMSSNRLDATIGNSAYFGIFCLMFVFISALLWAQSKQPKKDWLYPVLIVLNLIGLFYSGTRGTMIGVVVGGFITLSIMALKEKGKMRKLLAGSLIVCIVVLAGIFTFKDSSFIKNSTVLSRIASISPNDITGASRIAIWTISYKAWLEHPVLGYGQDNFSYVFARKFNPEKMCNLEPWYDRSHDVFFDWLVAAGILGLLSYLSLYGVTLWYMWKGDNDVSNREKAILTGMIAGYFIHNIFVFDNLISYILFFAMLAYITIRTRGAHATYDHGKAYFNAEQMSLLFVPVIGIALLITLYYVNYRPLIVNKLVIQGMSIVQLATNQKLSLVDAINIQRDSFVNAIAMNTLGSEEAREQFLQIAVRMAQAQIPPETGAADKAAIGQAINSIIQAARKDVETSLPAHKEDVRMLSIYGMFYNGIGDSQNGEQVLTLARLYAPKKQLLAFDLIRSHLIGRQYPEAYKLAKETYDLSITCNDALKWFMISGAYNGTYKEARSYALSKGQVQKFDGDILGAIVSTGQITLALELLNEVKKTNPEYTAQVDAYIKQILAPKK